MNGLKLETLRQVIAAEQIQKRVKELGRHISDDYHGQTIQALAVLENAFMFMADLVRALEVPVVCQFIKPTYSRQQGKQAGEIVEIFFSHTPDIRGQHILLVEGLVHSGVTSGFLMNDLRPRGCFSEACYAAGPPVGTPRGLTAGLLRLSGGRNLPGGLWVGHDGANQSQYSLPGCKSRPTDDLSHAKCHAPFSEGKGRIVFIRESPYRNCLAGI